MAKAETKLESVSVVLRGSFNPTIFQPRWLSAQGLIAGAAADAAQVGIIHPQICAFSAESFEIQVTADRFMAVTSDASFYDPLRDLVVGIFTVLNHTPLFQLGLNLSVHVQAGSLDSWNQIGHTLAPKAFWEPVLEEPGMRSLTIESPRPDKYKGHLQVKVEPSTRIQTGVFVDINDHFVLAATEQDEGWPVFVEIMDSQWGASRSRAEKISEHIQERV